MGHRVALLKDGVLQQVDTPNGIYNRPGNMFVAAFIGAPTMNLYHGTLGAVTADGTSVDLGGTTIAVPTAVLSEHPALGQYANRRVVVGVRPEDLFDPAHRPDLVDATRFRSTADLVEALGSDVLVHFGLDAEAAIVQSSDSLQELRASPKASRAVARLSSRSHVQIGAPIEVGIDVSRLHFFDPETTEAIRD
jgi:multiple sugar transport system ATP-binding protein